jgi:flagellar hook assembly protein FlgD
MVFKSGLLDSLQVSPENLDVFFAENTGFVKADEKVEIDTLKNKIYAQIEHFSTIVVKQKSDVTVADKRVDSGDETLRIYPNPFNTSTKIRYHLTNETFVNIAVYNMFGQKVKQLAEEIQPSGTHSNSWNGTNNSGSKVPNGIYFCRMLKDGRLNQVSRIVLNR